VKLLARASKLDDWAERRGGLKRQSPVGFRELMAEVRRPPLLWWTIASIALIVVGEIFLGLIGTLIGFVSWGLCCHRAGNNIRARHEPKDWPPGFGPPTT